MSYNISKELFEAVTGEDTGNVFEVYYKPRIDINSFFFRCKEWAFDMGYQINSYQNGCSIFIKPEYEPFLVNYEADSEQQSVFDACQWILENKDRK